MIVRLLRVMYYTVNKRRIKVYLLPNLNAGLS